MTVMSKRVVIVSAQRTPQGRFLGALAKHTAVDLAVTAGRAALQGIDPASIDRVIVGNVLGAGQGPNPARQIGLGLNLPQSCPAFTVNMVCASGMLAVSLTAQVILAGEAKVVLCGGTESMSNVPFLLDRARRGYKFGHGTLCDALIHDGLTDTHIGEHMGITAERLANEYGIGREDQDRFALRSQQRAAAAQRQGVFDPEITPVSGLEQDEHPRPDTTLKALSELKPAFDSGGSVSAGNASGINDGAAMLVVASAEAAQQYGWQPMAEIIGSAQVGCDPKRMGLGPVFATRKLCENLGCDVAGFDTLEINEAFAAQALACLNDMGLDRDADHINPHGGAIALGHPLGASGARLVVHLAHLIQRQQAERTLATLCVGGGMGASIALVSPSSS
jgi:acetyl-CoA C-acetyltransferase